jgi:hypothetical protein
LDLSAYDIQKFDLLVVALGVQFSSGPVSFTLTDSNGNGYSQVGGNLYENNGAGHYIGISLWYLVVPSDGGLVITYTPSGSSTTGISVLNFRNASRSFPLVSYSSNTDHAPSSSHFSAGTPSFSRNGGILICAMSPMAGVQFMHDKNPNNCAASAAGTYLSGKVPSDTPEEVWAVGTFNSTPNTAYVAIAAAFQRI